MWIFTSLWIWILIFRCCEISHPKWCEISHPMWCEISYPLNVKFHIQRWKKNRNIPVLEGSSHLLLPTSRLLLLPHRITCFVSQKFRWILSYQTGSRTSDFCAAIRSRWPLHHWAAMGEPYLRRQVMEHAAGPLRAIARMGAPAPAAAYAVWARGISRGFPTTCSMFAPHFSWSMHFNCFA